MIDNALRAAEGRTIAEHRAEIADLWARLQPWRRPIPTPRSADRWTPSWIATASPDNRPLAFPYNKWHSTQWTVNQAAALVLLLGRGGAAHGCPVRPLGLPPGGARVEPRRVGALPRADRCLAGHGGPGRQRRRPGSGDRSTRSRWSRSTAAFRRRSGSNSGRSASTRRAPRRSPGAWPSPAGRSTTSSCSRWPRWSPRCVPRPTIWALVTTVSGLLTKPGLGVWSARPDGRPPLLSDLAYEVESVTGVVEAVDDARRVRGTGHRRHLHRDLRRHGSGPGGGRVRHRRREAVRVDQLTTRRGRPGLHGGAGRHPGSGSGRARSPRSEYPPGDGSVRGPAQGSGGLAAPGRLVGPLVTAPAALQARPVAALAGTPDDQFRHVRRAALRTRLVAAHSSTAHPPPRVLPSACPSGRLIPSEP